VTQTVGDLWNGTTAPNPGREVLLDIL
jgi:hypothetical protein